MSSNKKKEPETKNAEQETPETPQRPCGLPRGISEVLDHIMNDKKKPMTLSERIIKLARDRDFIFDRINEWQRCPTCPPASFHLSELSFASLLLFPEFTVVLGVKEQREVSLRLLVFTPSLISSKSLLLTKPNCQWESKRACQCNT